MIKDWKIESFSDCFSSIKIPKKVPKKYFLTSGKFPIVSQEKGLVNAYWNNHNDVIKVTKPIIVFGDHTQIIKLIDFDFVVGADGTKLLLVSDCLDTTFAYYFLLSSPVKSQGYSRHFKFLKRKNIPVPPLAEQKKIVAILDEVFAAIEVAKANTEKNLANAREVFESHLNRVFEQKGEGWEEKRLGDVCRLQSGSTFPKDYEQPSGQIAYLKVSDLNISGNETEIQTSSRFINLDLVSKKKIIPRGSVIFPKRGGAIATNKKRITSINICADLNIMAVIPPDYVNPYLLYYFFQRFDLAKIGSGSSIPQINNYDIEPIHFNYPENMMKQNEIVDFLDKQYNNSVLLVSIYQQKLKALDELKQSLLQKAFSGELTAKKHSVEKELEEASV